MLRVLFLLTLTTLGQGSRSPGCSDLGLELDEFSDRKWHATFWLSAHPGENVTCSQGPVSWGLGEGGLSVRVHRQVDKFKLVHVFLEPLDADPEESYPDDSYPDDLKSEVQVTEFPSNTFLLESPIFSSLEGKNLTVKFYYKTLRTTTSTYEEFTTETSTLLLTDHPEIEETSTLGPGTTFLPDPLPRSTAGPTILPVPSSTTILPYDELSTKEIPDSSNTPILPYDELITKDIPDDDTTTTILPDELSTKDLPDSSSTTILPDDELSTTARSAYLGQSTSSHLTIPSSLTSQELQRDGVNWSFDDVLEHPKFQVIDLLEESAEVRNLRSTINELQREIQELQKECKNKNGNTFNTKYTSYSNTHGTAQNSNLCPCPNPPTTPRYSTKPPPPTRWPPGEYCSKLDREFCRGRNDACKVPIADTFCYCDEFCNSTARSSHPSQDCCPDYFYRDPRLPRNECDHNGMKIKENQTVEINCKICTCVRSCSDNSLTLRCDSRGPPQETTTKIIPTTSTRNPCSGDPTTTTTPRSTPPRTPPPTRWPPGEYCSKLHEGSCRGRNDACKVPISNTFCYCDEFCNSTARENFPSQDCCPDYFDFNRDHTSANTAGKIVVVTPWCQYDHQGHKVMENQSVKVNCNTCTCVRSVRDKSLVLQCDTQECLVDPELVRSVNHNPGLGWRAHEYPEFWARTLNEGIRFRLGALLSDSLVVNSIPLESPVGPLPSSFDARSKWAGLVGPVSDQGWCGASWALSTAHVVGDRLAIASRGAETVRLSGQQLIECVYYNQRRFRGCEGGQPSFAWAYFGKQGVVEEHCHPYTGRSGTGCPYPRNVRSLKALSCTTSSHLAARNETFRTSPTYPLRSEREIMADIVKSGPVQATMSVPRDFFSYQSGVYRPIPGLGHTAGYHSVRIVGWGHEGGVKYWVAANSWGPWWGEDGYFRILRGENTCEVERHVLAAWPVTVRSSTGPN